MVVFKKLSPRSMFWGQVLASAVACTVQLGVQAWMFTNVQDICSLTQKNGFSCPNTQVFGTASIIWGVIGPARQFSPGQIYYGLVFFFLVGFIVPVCNVCAIPLNICHYSCVYDSLTLVYKIVAATEEIP